jgi:hypothetical protein
MEMEDGYPRMKLVSVDGDEAQRDDSDASRGAAADNGS